MPFFKGTNSSIYRVIVMSGLQVGCSNNFVMAPPDMHLCVAWHCYGGAALHTFFMWDRQAEGKHSDFFGFHYSDHSSVVIPGNDIQKNNTCCILKACRHLSTDGTHLKFIFLGEVVWHHSTIFHLDLGSKWWTQVSDNLQHK
jgi:hypothetical protein